jgi:UDP-arabinose 4-epimerase
VFQDAYAKIPLDCPITALRAILEDHFLPQNSGCDQASLLTFLIGLIGCCGANQLNILVTGGAGYIGSQACKALAAKGYVPITYDNLSRGNVWAVKWGPLEKGDIADGQRLHTVLEKYRPRALTVC